MGHLLHDGKYARLSSTAEIFETGMNAAVVKLAEAATKGPRAGGASREPLKVLGKHPRTEAEIKLMAGRFGAYVTDGTTNATLPKSIEQDALTLEEAAQLIDTRAAAAPAKKGKKPSAKRRPHPPRRQRLRRRRRRRLDRAGDYSPSRSATSFMKRASSPPASQRASAPIAPSMSESASASLL